ncbi:MAG: segregation/condensation protein A [Tissierellia bacterium]|nr:segregation/condensation protein A [Tissierellia bacterium]
MESVINVSIKNIYDGPMDLLLSLIKKEKIDIYDIPISNLTDKFLATMGEISYKNLESFLEFSDMAATLLQIKSKLLLPIFEDESEEEDPRESLVNRIIEYNYFKNLSEILLGYYDIGSIKLEKKPEDLTILAMSEQIDYKEMDISKLAKSFLNLIKENTIDNIVYDFDIEDELITVEEGIAFLKEKLISFKTINFESLFSENTTKLEVVTYFLAILELTKIGKIVLKQNVEEGIIIAKTDEKN